MYRVHIFAYINVLHCIFHRVTSVNRALSSQGSDGASSQLCVIQLISHLNLNAARLQQILQGIYILHCTVYMYIQYLYMYSTELVDDTSYSQ